MIVVDTNILVYNSFPNPKSETVDKLARIDPYWAAPLLWRSEMRNVLSGYIRNGKFGVPDAEKVIAHAASRLLGGEHAITDNSVFGLVVRSRCTAYDCEFAGLAAALSTVLVTEDKALIASFPESAGRLTMRCAGVFRPTEHEGQPGPGQPLKAGP